MIEQKTDTRLKQQESKFLEGQIAKLGRFASRYKSNEASGTIHFFMETYTCILDQNAQLGDDIILKFLTDLSQMMIQASAFFLGYNKLRELFNKNLIALSHYHLLNVESLYVEIPVQFFDQEFRFFEKLLDDFCGQHSLSFAQQKDLNFLRERLVFITSAVEDTSSKSKILRCAIKRYVADSMPCKPGTLAYLLMVQYLAYEENITSLKKFTRLELEDNTVGIRTQSILSDLTLKRRVDPDLYSHMTLKCVNDKPSDRCHHLLPDGWYSFVLMPSKKIRFCPILSGPEEGYDNLKKVRSHSQISGGSEVIAGGHFLIEEEKIVRVNCDSGHYGTNAICYVDLTLTQLEKMGFDASNIIKEVVERSADDFSKRRTRKLGIMWRGLFMSGDKAEGRPDPSEMGSRFEKIIPKY